MSDNVNLVSILFDGFVLSLAFVFVLLLLWHDRYKRQIQLLAVLLLVLTGWNAGLMLVRAATFSAQYDPDSMLLGAALIEGGIAASNVAFYAFISTLAGTRSPRLVRVAVMSIAAIISMRVVFTAWAWAADTLSVIEQPRINNLPVLFFLLYAGLGLQTLYTQRRKITNGLLRVGSVLFAVGQFLTLINADIGITAFATNTISLGGLFIVLSIVEAEMIQPLAERGRQVATLYHVGKEIAGNPRLIPVLEEISKQAASWVGGDAGGVFLREGDHLRFVAGYNMPSVYTNHTLGITDGVAGMAAQTGRSQRVERYGVDWRAKPDFPHAPLAFGSMIATPILSREQVSGVLIAVTGHHGKLLRDDDVYRLELLAPQAALVIGYTNLLDLKTALAETIEDSRQQLETVLTSTESPVIAVDRRMHLIFANPAAYSVLELNDAAIGDNISNKVLRELMPPDLHTLARDLRTNNNHLFEVNLGQRTYQCHLARLGNARRSGWVAILNDVTQLKELDRMKGEMIRMVSHDLKNPLMAAMLQIDLMRYQNDGLSSEPIDVMERQLERMNRIIRGVLDVERLRSGSLKLGPAYLSSIVEKAVNDLHRLADEAGIAIDYDIHEDLTVLCDENHAERAISNLIENAIKFTSRGGSVMIKGAVQEDAVVVLVRDTGVGIPESIQPNIFQRFFRGQQRGFEFVSGTGLGLALVRAIMDNHGGQVWFESREGEGTTFFLRFQRSDAPVEVY